MSYKELGKYEYLSGEDLGYKTGVVEQAKLEYSLLGKVFNKGLEKEDKKEGLFKRLKNIEDKNKDQLKAIKYQGKKQLDATEKNNQLKVKKKDDKKKDIVYLKEGVDKLVDLYPNSSNNKSIIFLENIRSYENKINYNDLSYKILFTKEYVIRSHERNFLNKYGMLYD